jgi:hypothetical protein
MRGKYLYCITKELEPARFSVAGIEGALVHVVNWQELSCVVSDTDLGDSPPHQQENCPQGSKEAHERRCGGIELSKESAMAHEKVLEEVMQYSPIVPIAFGHVAKSEDEIKSKLLEAHQGKLEEWLAYLDGKIELSLKAFWLDLNPVLRNIADTSSEIQKIKAKGKLAREDQMRAGEIAAKLLGKKREEMEENIAHFFKDIIIEHKKSNLFGEQMITNIAFLINQDNLKAFDRKMNEYEGKLRDSNVKLKYTGPVPPYNFVDLNVNLNSKP